MRRLGFTLIEILLAVGLMVVVLSIVGPALFSRIAPATFDYTLEQLAAELRLAREDARRTGQVRLVYVTREQLGRETGPADSDVGRVWIESRLSPPADPDSQPQPSAGQGFSLPDSQFADTFDLSAEDEKPRLLVTLPDGFDLVFQKPEFLLEDSGFGDSMSEGALNEIGGLTPDTLGQSQNPSEFTGYPDDLGSDSDLIVVCVPDGTVLLARPVWLTAPDDRAARLIVGSASGVIRFETVKPRRDAFDLMPAGPAQGDPRRAPSGGSP